MATATQAQRQPPPPSAAKYGAISALIAAKAAAEVGQQASQGAKGLAAMFASIFRYQVMTATLAEHGVVQMLADQDYDHPGDAELVPTAFTIPRDTFEPMVDSVLSDETEEAARQARVERMAESILQESARLAQQVAITARPDVVWVRQLNLPSCSRCAVLAGIEGTWSTGFARHPGCDCYMLPTTEAPKYLEDPVELAREGKVTGLSKADMRALDSGADFNKVVNVRRKAAGLTVSGQVLTRAGQLTPAGIYDQAGDDREYAVELLRKSGYLH